MGEQQSRNRAEGCSAVSPPRGDWGTSKKGTELTPIGSQSGRGESRAQPGPDKASREELGTACTSASWIFLSSIFWVFHITFKEEIPKPFTHSEAVKGLYFTTSNPDEAQKIPFSLVLIIKRLQKDTEAQQRRLSLLHIPPSWLSPFALLSPSSDLLLLEHPGTLPRSQPYQFKMCS